MLFLDHFFTECSGKFFKATVYNITIEENNSSTAVFTLWKIFFFNVLSIKQNKLGACMIDSHRLFWRKVH